MIGIKTKEKISIYSTALIGDCFEVGKLYDRAVGDRIKIKRKKKAILSSSSGLKSENWTIYRAASNRKKTQKKKYQFATQKWI